MDVIQSDLSVFHRVDDVARMPAHRLCELAPLLPAYSGALAARLEHERSGQAVTVHTAAPSPGEAAQPASAAALRLKYPGLIE